MPYRRGSGALPAALRRGRSSPLPFRSGSERIEHEKRNRVNKIELVGPDNLFGVFAQSQSTINVPGDHVYVDEINGSSPVYLRFDRRDGPSIQLEEGMTLTREFQKLLVSFDYPLFAQDDRTVPVRLPATKVVLFVTFGEFQIARPEKTVGMEPGFLSRFACVATTAPRVLWVDAMTEFTAFSPNPDELFGKKGATLSLTNEDLANTLYFKYTDASDLGPADASNQRNWYPVLPGQTVTMRLESLMNRRVSLFTTSAGNVYVATTTGTARYAWLLSRAPVYGPTGSGYAGDAIRP